MITGRINQVRGPSRARENAAAQRGSAALICCPFSLPSRQSRKASGLRVLPASISPLPPVLMLLSGPLRPRVQHSCQQERVSVSAPRRSLDEGFSAQDENRVSFASEGAWQGNCSPRQ